MDSLSIKNQKPQTASSEEHVDFHVQEHVDEQQYRVFELGRAYRRGDHYASSYFDREEGRLDVREVLEDRESDNAAVQEDVSPEEEVVNNEDNEIVFVQGDSHEEVSHEESGEDVTFTIKDLPITKHESVLHLPHISRKFVYVSVIALCVLLSGIFAGTAVAVKKRVEEASGRAVIAMKSAKSNIELKKYSALGEDISTVHEEFVIASDEMEKINSIVKMVSRFIPGASKLSSGNHIIEAGKHLTHTAVNFEELLPIIEGNNEELLSPDGEHVSFLKLYRLIAERLNVARYDITQAQQHLEKVQIDDVPAEYRDAYLEMKELLPEINAALKTATESHVAIEDMLGANGPRTYLLLFQNNHEMRATGGFIGSYGLVKVNKGKLEKFFVDDIYNPDGQLIDRIVPPLPIQKISANWSLHDSNWFPNFPVSARKSIDFYERTGGPTVDGVVAVTPEMMKKFLKITGPVHVSDYGVTLTAENFMEIMQDEIEDRDNYIKKTLDQESVQKTEQQEAPKKILSELVPLMTEKLSDKKNPKGILEMVSAASEGLKERHIVMYASNDQIQKIITESGWAGDMLQTDRDYLSVINTNINGFKTDGVIEEHITHRAEIDDEGYITNTVSIRREHKGGFTGYPWWDAVNANYMRVYVPENSQLISVEGQTREINEERLDYDVLGYERDSDVQREELSMQIDEETGTRIYSQYGKTVFGNWVYVSPQESATITYTYRLPYRVDFEKSESGEYGSYSIVFQKQAGSLSSQVKSDVSIASKHDVAWHSHQNDDLSMEDSLENDRYHGIVFEKK